MDLNRLAPEVTALQTAPATIAILEARASRLYDSLYVKTRARAYVAASLSGQKVVFVTETQLSTSQIPHTTLLVIPDAVHIHSTILRGLRQFTAGGGQLIVVGAHAASRDEHDQALNRRDRDAALTHAIWDTLNTDSSVRAVIAQQIHTRGLSQVHILDATTHLPADSVEWRAVQRHGDWLIDVVNLGTRDIHAVLEVDGQAVAEASDLLSGETWGTPSNVLRTYTPVLLTVPRIR